MQDFSSLQQEYPKIYIRIYERRKLDCKIRSKNVYMLIQGEYYTPSQKTGKDEEGKVDELEFGGRMFAK
jgi:hypothetical protein